MALIAVLQALALSAATGWALMHFVFEDVYVWSPLWAARVAGGALTVALVTRAIFGSRFQRGTAGDALRAF